MEDYSLADCKTQEFIAFRYMRSVMGICLMMGYDAIRHDRKKHPH